MAQTFKKIPQSCDLVKSEKFPCGCTLEWDGKKVTVNICEWHSKETRKLKPR